MQLGPNIGYPFQGNVDNLIVSLAFLCLTVDTTDDRHTSRLHDTLRSKARLEMVLKEKSLERDPVNQLLFFKESLSEIPDIGYNKRYGGAQGIGLVRG